MKIEDMQMWLNDRPGRTMRLGATIDGYWARATSGESTYCATGATAEAALRRVVKEVSRGER